MCFAVYVFYFFITHTIFPHEFGGHEIHPNLRESRTRGFGYRVERVNMGGMIYENSALLAHHTTSTSTRTCRSLARHLCQIYHSSSTALKMFEIYYIYI